MRCSLGEDFLLSRRKGGLHNTGSGLHGFYLVKPESWTDFRDRRSTWGRAYASQLKTCWILGTDILGNVSCLHIGVGISHLTVPGYGIALRISNFLPRPVERYLASLMVVELSEAH